MGIETVHCINCKWSTTMELGVPPLTDHIICPNCGKREIYRG